MKDEEKKNKDHEDESEEFNDLKNRIYDELPKELQDDFKQILNLKNLSNKKLRKYSQKLIIPGIKSHFLDFLIFFIFNTLLLCALFGYFNIFKDIVLWKILIFAGTFTMLDYIYKKIMFVYFPATIIKSFGTVNVLGSIILMICTVILYRYTLQIIIVNTSLAIGLFIIFLVVKIIIKSYLQRRIL